MFKDSPEGQTHSFKKPPTCDTCGQPMFEVGTPGQSEDFVLDDSMTKQPQLDKNGLTEDSSDHLRTEGKTLDEKIRLEVKRCKELLVLYQETPEGWWGASVIKESLYKANLALNGDDVKDKNDCLKDLKSIEG